MVALVALVDESTVHGGRASQTHANALVERGEVVAVATAAGVEELLALLVDDVEVVALGVGRAASDLDVLQTRRWKRGDRKPSQWSESWSMRRCRSSLTVVAGGNADRNLGGLLVWQTVHSLVRASIHVGVKVLANFAWLARNVLKSSSSQLVIRSIPKS